MTKKIYNTVPIQSQEIEEPTNIMISSPTMSQSYSHRTLSMTHPYIYSDRLEDKFYCDIQDCDFKTKSTSHLKLHKKSVHEGIKYQCDLCDRSYNFPGYMSLKLLYLRYVQKHFIGDLRRHKKTTHEGLRYPCQYCDFTASQTQTLKNHIAKHHSLESSG